MPLTPEQFNSLKAKLQTPQTSAGGIPDEKFNQIRKKLIAKKEEAEGIKGVGGFALGAGKSLIGGTVGVAGMLQGFGQRVLAGLTPGKTYEDVRKETGLKSLKEEEPEGAGVLETLKPKGKAERAGATTETIAEFAVPGLLGLKTAKGMKVAKAGAEVAKKAVGVPGKVVKGISDVLFGPESTQAIKTGFQKPALQKKILTGEITTETIAGKVGKAAKDIQKGSMAKLEKARAAIKGEISGKSVAQKINKTMTSAIKDKPFLPDEKRIVNNLSKFLRENIKIDGSIEKKSVDILRKRIDDAGFYKTGAIADKFKNSNKVVDAVRKSLNEISTLGNLKFKSALKVASDDIRFFEKLGKNIVGKDGNLNADFLQNKINQLVKAIDDPNTRQGSLKLLKELATRAEIKGDFINELETLSRSLPLKEVIPFKRSITGATGGIMERIVAKTARGAGRGAETIKEIILKRAK